ncbi:cytoplasmic polyadenylation element-binding 2 isoform X2 [Brachionus plicatilis]|uniref:Cytoplasmic polyadenylation element-binding 2 isoform X2 n=1 Tax=Brachionus plicatilis TaxID=10195 RepID=A0A3M7R2Y2_BRAPC|nr:cytoplasmic polyadenylation element-binding 2 isoform X2 [Brachionus plicatilis]
MDIKSSCDAELEHKSDAEAKLEEETQSVSSSSSSPNNDNEAAKSSADEPTQLSDLIQHIESQQLHQQLVNALLNPSAQQNSSLLAAMMAASKSPGHKWQPQLSSVWQNALNAASQSPASSSSSASSTSNTPQPIHKSHTKAKTSSIKTPNINMTSAALLANLASPSLNKSQSGSQRSLVNSSIYQLQNTAVASSSSSSPTASVHNIAQSASANPILSSNNLNLVDENLANSAPSINSLQATLASLNLNNSQTHQQDELNNLLNNQFLLDLIRQDPSQIENVLKLKNLVQMSDETSGASTSSGLPSTSSANLIDELQQQFDQTVPANLVAAAVAAATNQHQYSSNAFLQRNSVRPSAQQNTHLMGQNQYQANLASQFNIHSLKHQLNPNYLNQQQFFGNQQQQQPNMTINLNQLAQHPNALQLLQSSNLGGQFGDYQEERFSRKVFVGGLPPDIDEDEIVTHFRRYGNLIVDWPHKAESKSYFPPKGYAFLIFQEERSVQELIEQCVMDDGKLYMVVSSPSMKDKPVQIRPWCLADSDFVMDGSQPLDPRKTIFVGGVPRPLKAIELAMIMDRFYGGVCYAGIDTDPELKYPKGAGRVAFSNQQSYIAAISARFVQLQHGEIDKRVEVKPYVLDDQMCDECQGVRCGGKFAPFFCANVTCLQYYCEACWATIHTRPGREYHKPLVKEGADRPRPLPYK